MLELHVWGPGFGLPSIDPLCLAAIAYLNLVLPREEWKVVPSSNPLLSPNKHLPALLRPARLPQNRWISGLPQIVAYLSQLPGTPALESDLSPRERASSLALAAFIQSRAQPILDLALYVDHKNYAGVMRPLLARMLPWPMGWREPGVRRAEARERTAGLGLLREGARMEMAHVMGETPGERAVREANAGGATGGGVVIGREAQLRKLLNELLAPLEKRVKENEGPYLFGDIPSYADCVAVGYLSLILMPELPNPWAREGLMARQRLAAYVHDMRARMLHGVEVGEVQKADLPWLGGVILDGFRETMKGWKSGTGEEEWKDDDPLVEERKKKAFLQKRREWWKSVGFVTAGLLGMGAYVVWSGIVAFGGPGGQGGEEYEEEEHEEGQEPEPVDMGDDDDDE